MKGKAACVIIGGGVIGCSIAYHLAKRSVKDVILLEKDFLASKATGIFPGGIRQQWSSEIGCLLSKSSVEFFKNLREELCPEISLNFVQSGYLFLAHSERALKAYERNVALQNSLGIDSEIISVEEIRAIVPAIDTRDVLGGAFCQEDGYLEDCHGFTHVLASRAQEMGVRIVYDEAVEIVLDRDRVSGVKGKKGELQCQMAVNAAGCDSASLAASIGIKLPVVPSKRRLLYTQKVEEHFLGPCVASLERGWGGKQLREGHVYMAYIGKGAEALSNYEFIERSVELGMEIVPRLCELRIHRLQEGYYDTTPDSNPILGGVEGIVGYYQAVGFSGHGFMLAPAIGKAMAQLLTGEKPFVDLTSWHLDRFRGGKAREEDMVL
ncbi:MAG: NAD(P)/FAD-dependent oxidoreductase [Thermodesulfobacteriota bacterium]